MSVWDYLLPWKAVPNMIKDVKDVAKPSGKNEHGSIVGAIGKYADPGGALLGDRWMEFWHERVPAKVNEYLEPVGEFHRKYLDPIAMAAPEDSKLQKVPDFVQAKGGDSVAAVLGAIYGLPAIFGAMGECTFRYSWITLCRVAPSRLGADTPSTRQMVVSGSPSLSQATKL